MGVLIVDNDEAVLEGPTRLRRAGTFSKSA